jgi:hypothetical protein
MTIKHMQGGASLDRKLKMLTKPTKPIKKGMDNYLGFLRKKITPYPPATAANRKPGINGYSWYVRNFGTRTVTGKAYPTSEQMSKKWTFKTRVRGASVRGEIINLASYSPYVQGEQQARFHAMRGWKRADKVIDASLQVGARFIGDEVDRELRK